MSRFDYRITIRQDDDLDEIINKFLAKFHLYQGADNNQIASSVSRTVKEFAARGGELAKLGSVLRAERVIEGDRHRIVVAVDFRRRNSLLARLFGLNV